MIDRYEPVDWYKDNRPKTFRDNETGEEISLHEYRKRRKEARAIDEGADEPDDELETQAFADPAPRPRLFDVSASREGDERPEPGVRRMGIAEMLGPAVAGFATSIALIRLRESPRQVFVPPKEVTTPILSPLGRIVDRHLPVELAMLMGEDGKDVSACVVALGAGMVWFKDAMKQYEEYREYERQQYDAQRRGTRNTAPAVDDPDANWSGDIIQRVRRGNEPGGGNLAYRDARSNGTADAGGVREVSGAEAASRIADLLHADAEGALRRGLVDQ